MKRLWEKYSLHFRIKVQIPVPTLGLRESLPEHRRPIREWGGGEGCRDGPERFPHTASSPAAQGPQKLAVPSSADFRGAACPSGTGPGGGGVGGEGRPGSASLQSSQVRGDHPSRFSLPIEPCSGDTIVRAFPPRYFKVELFPCGILLIEADSSGSAYFKFLKNELLNNLGGGPAQEDPCCVYWQGRLSFLSPFRVIVEFLNNPLVKCQCVTRPEHLGLSVEERIFRHQSCRALRGRRADLCGFVWEGK